MQEEQDEEQRQRVRTVQNQHHDREQNDEQKHPEIRHHIEGENQDGDERPEGDPEDQAEKVGQQSEEDRRDHLDRQILHKEEVGPLRSGIEAGRDLAGQAGDQDLRRDGEDDATEEQAVRREDEAEEYRRSLVRDVRDVARGEGGQRLLPGRGKHVGQIVDERLVDREQDVGFLHVCLDPFTGGCDRGIQVRLQLGKTVAERRDDRENEQEQNGEQEKFREDHGKDPRQRQPAFGLENVAGQQPLEKAHRRHADKGEQDRVENALDLSEEPRQPCENRGKIEYERRVEKSE